MRKDNPAVYECRASKDKLHTWLRLASGRAECVKCEKIISEKDADEVFHERT